MGSKSKSKSSTSTSTTDSRQFRVVEQGLTDGAVGTGQTETRGTRNQVTEQLSAQDVSGDDSLVVGAGARVSLTDRGSIDALENVAEFALDAGTGGLVSALDFADRVASMAFADRSNQTAEFAEVLSGVQQGQERSIQAVESVLAEKQTDGNQDTIKTLIVAGAVVGTLAVMSAGSKKR